MLLTREEQVKRKQTAKMKTIMAELDRRVKPTKSTVIHHPRFYNKPYSCELGRHDLFTDMMMGVPFLTCRKCGWTTLKSAHEGNETKSEIRANPVGKPPTIITRDIVDLFYPERRKRWEVI